jgi:hypothetical protein
MNTSADLPEPEELEHQADVARAQVDETLDALAGRVSLQRRASEAVEALSSAAAGAYRRASPEITTLIRLDHSHVLAAFRRYHSGSSPARKRAIATHVCLALQIHAQLEEEIFYRALFEAGVSTEVLDKSVNDHEEMRSLIGVLRGTAASDAAHDSTFARLIRAVIHHVAEEETVLLPLAEAKLYDELRELGWKMTARRIELLKPHAAEVATTAALTFPVAVTAAALGVCAGVWLLLRRWVASSR